MINEVVMEMSTELEKNKQDTNICGVQDARSRSR